MTRSILLATALLAIPFAAQAQAQTQDGPATSDAELAAKLSNPVAALISVPLQFNYDCCIGPEEAGRYTLNVQPVVPVKLSDNWNMIVRTIVPIIYQERTSPASGAASGLGDITQSFFFAPRSTGGLTWAIGPALLYPTGESELGSKKWGAGPTALILKQTPRGFTYGMLANHIWSYADLGHNQRRDISTTFVQPFLSWTSPTATTVGINAESSYNWEDDQWSIPVNMTVSHLYNFGGQRVSLGGGARIYAARDAPAGQGPEWGLRFTATLLFPE